MNQDVLNFVCQLSCKFHSYSVRWKLLLINVHVGTRHLSVLSRKLNVWYLAFVLIERPLFG